MISPLLLAAVLVGPAADSTATSGEPWSVLQLVRFHQQSKRDLAVQDVYKLLYQGNLGVEHLLGDSAVAARYLQEEFLSIDETPRTEELMERISLDNELVRVNLRPYKALKLPPELLVRCMRASARETRPDTAGFQRQWNEFRGLVDSGRIAFPADDVQRWEERLRHDGLKAIHHSEGYMSTNHPAYRVVRRTVFERMVTMPGSDIR